MSWPAMLQPKLCTLLHALGPCRRFRGQRNVKFGHPLNCRCATWLVPGVAGPGRHCVGGDVCAGTHLDPLSLTVLTSFALNPQVEAAWLVPDGAALAAMIAQGLMAQHLGTQQGLVPDAVAAAPADGAAADAAADSVVVDAAADAGLGQDVVAAGSEADAAGEAAAAAVEGVAADGAAATGPAGPPAMDASATTAAPADEANEQAPGGA